MIGMRGKNMCLCSLLLGLMDRLVFLQNAELMAIAGLPGKGRHRFSITKASLAGHSYRRRTKERPTRRVSVR